MVAQGFTVDLNKPLVFQVKYCQRFLLFISAKISSSLLSLLCMFYRLVILVKSTRNGFTNPLCQRKALGFLRVTFGRYISFFLLFFSLFINRHCVNKPLIFILWHACDGTVLDPYKMVGGSCNLVASFSLVHLHVSKNGPFSRRNRPIDSLGNIHLDVYWIHSPPVPFPHQDEELLVRHTHSLFFLCVLQFGSCMSDPNVIVGTITGETRHTIFFTGAITSTQWTTFDSSFLLLQHWFYAFL